MGTVATKLTVDQFLAMPEREDVREELVDGEIIEMGRGGLLHETVKSSFTAEVVYYFKSNKLRGRTYSETVYYLTKTDALMPDVSVVLSGELDPQGSGRITAIPDIAIEVVSSETASRLQQKIRLYLDNGVKAVWVAYPELTIIDVYTEDRVRRLKSSDKLEQTDLLPGFSVPVSDFFRTR